jgi:hypothetical protein
MRPLKGGILALLLTLLVVPAAHAAQRYVVPDSSSPEGEVCTQAEPCSLKVGVRDAKTNDEVIIGPGTYELDEAIDSSASAENVNVHGELGGPMPRIVASVPINSPIGFAAKGGRLGYLDIFNGKAFAFGAFCFAGSVERVRVQVVGDDSVGIRQGPGCTVRDSLVRADGQGARGIDAGSSSGDGSAIARNVTAVATGPDSVGILTSFTLNPFGGTPGTFTLDLKNAIASGGKTDLEAADPFGFGGAAKLVVANSNFDSTANGKSGTVVDAGGNQAAPPLFVDAASGDYREAAGSPTIDAGINDQLGSIDLGGNARLLGPAPDIGAFEVVPPFTPVAAAAEITSLAVAPKAFRPAGAGGAILSAKKKARAPIGANVTYRLSGAAAVTFAVERRVAGRKVGKRCAKKTKANQDRKKCPRFKRVRGSFSHSGAAGQNRFKFSGRLAKALAVGSYRLTGQTTASSRTANFKIVK